MPISDELRFALRSLRKRPGFALAVVLTLALGIGANSGVFSLINAMLLAPLPVARPSELVNIYTLDSTGTRYGGTSYPDYVSLRDDTRSFSGIFAYSGLMTTMTGGGDPEVIFGEIVTGNYFAESSARLLLGRGFSPEEDRTPGSHPVVVLGHRLWQRRFARDSTVIGRAVTLNGHPFTVIGVAAPEFTGLLFRGLAADLWAPVMMMGQLRADQLSQRDERWLFVKGRLASGVAPAQAAADARTAGARLAAAFPESNRGRSFAALPSVDVHVSPEADRVLLPSAIVVVALVGIILLIACTNLANLMLARAAARRREIAVRLSLGATRSRLVRQMLTEAGMFAALGGGAGLLLAQWFARLLVAFRPPTPVPIALDVVVDGRVVAFTALLSIVSCGLFGLVPAVRATKPVLSADLSPHGTASGRWSGFGKLRQAFLLPQLALTLVLLVVAGLFARSVGRAGAVETGFDARRSAMIALNLALDGYDENRAQAFYAELSRRMQGIPGVRSTAIADRIPLDLYGNQTATIGVVPASGGALVETSVQYARVGAGYFDALGVRVAIGRSFSEAELMSLAPVALLSEAGARRFWPGRDAVGQRVRWGSELVEVIGVVPDVKIQTLGESPQPFLYRPLHGGESRLLRFVVGAEGSSEGLPGALRAAVRAIDPAVAVFESRTMTDHLDVMLWPYRLAARVGTVLGLFGLLLASVGLYGVVAFGVARRTREFGIRLALGAQTAGITRMVIGESARVVALSVAVGLALALGVARLLSSVLFGIGATDPVTFVAVPTVLTVVALFATWIPTRRAVEVSPAAALREE